MLRSTTVFVVLDDVNVDGFTLGKITDWEAESCETGDAFVILTRSRTSDSPPSSCEELTEIALGLRAQVNLEPDQTFRLVGVGLSKFRQSDDLPSQSALFE